MTRADIDAGWPLVLQRREQVLRLLEDIAKRCRTSHRFDRALLVRLYRPECDLRDLAKYFAVSTGAINDALSRLVRIARTIERTETLESVASGKRLVVIVPVEHGAEAEYVRAVLATHELQGVIEELDSGEEWGLEPPDVDQGHCRKWNGRR